MTEVAPITERLKRLNRQAHAAADAASQRALAARRRREAAAARLAELHEEQAARLRWADQAAEWQADADRAAEDRATADEARQTARHER